MDCQGKVNYCLTKNCSGNGVCSPKSGKFIKVSIFNIHIVIGKCVCSEGFNGENCEVAKNSCEKKNCSGNGVCNPKTGKFIYY